MEQSRRRKRSLAWEYFDTNDDSSATVKCKICKKDVSSKSGNTTNLFSHLKLHHYLQFREMQYVRQEDSEHEQQDFEQ